MSPSRIPPCIAIAATLALVAPCSPAQEPMPAPQQDSALEFAAPRGPCKIAGTWIGNSPPFFPDMGDQTLVFVETITPLDGSCRWFSTTLTPVNPELTFAGLFPEVTHASPSFGQLRRAARNVYEVEIVTYFTAAPPPDLPIRGTIIYSWTLKGTVRCLDDACTEKLQDGVLSLYSHIDDAERMFPPLGIAGVMDQDMNDDGFPDEGEVPIFQAPFPLTSRKMSQ